jgi:hypothetical protein
MPPGLVAGIVFARAGAITSAKRIGVASGAKTSRGVRALSAMRRRVRVVHALTVVGRRTAGRDGRLMVWGAAMVVMGFLEKSGGEAVAGEL